MSDLPFRPAHALAATLLGLALLTPLPASAQALTWTTVSSMEMAGVMGSMMSMFSDMDEPTTETVWVGEGMMRTDSEESSTIMNLAEGRMIQIDHDARTWFAVEFGDMEAMSERMRADAAAEMESGDPEAGEMPEFEGEFDVERTGVTREVGGYDAEQVLMTLTMEARDEEQEGEPLAGRMVLLTEMWMSEELASHPAFAEMREGAMEFARGGMSSGEFGPMAADPRMADAMERMQEEFEGLDGMAVRTTSLFLLLPGELEFDREAAVASLEEELSGDGPSLADLAGAGAARSALGGLFGRRDEPEEPEVGQQPLMRMVQEVRDVRSVDLDPTLFQPPADYREVESPWGGVPDTP